MNPVALFKIINFICAGCIMVSNCYTIWSSTLEPVLTARFVILGLGHYQPNSRIQRDQLDREVGNIVVCLRGCDSDRAY